MKRSRKTPWLIAALCVGCLVLGACKRSRPTATVDARPAIDAEIRRGSARPDPGPPRAETAQRVAAARAEAARLTKALRAGGVAAREVTSVADIRGFRLFKRRSYRQAQVWFEAAVGVDPTFEPSLYNAALTAAVLGDPARARRHLAALRRLGTPLSRRRLSRATRNGHLGRLLRTAPSPSL